VTPPSIHAKSKRIRRHNRPLQASIPTARILLKFNKLLVSRGGIEYSTNSAILRAKRNAVVLGYPGSYPAHSLTTSRVRSSSGSCCDP
jgi:hypothetical protein